jgi:hypothetical protein
MIISMFLTFMIMLLFKKALDSRNKYQQFDPNLNHIFAYRKKLEVIKSFLSLY